MPFELIHSSQAPRSPDQPDVLGYFYNHGGLNNQKMALVALFLQAIRDRKVVNLPYIHNRDQTTTEEYLVRIEQVFDIERILAFARRHGLTILHECPGGERGGWDYFRGFSDLLGMMDGPSAGTILREAIGCLRPLVVDSPEFQSLAEMVRKLCPGGTVVQLRIEKDWLFHCEQLRKIYPGMEGLDAGFPEILSRVHSTFPRLERVYVVSDEKSMPVLKSDIRAFALAMFDLDLVWKSDLLPDGYCECLTPLELSMIDFAVAKRSACFVGLKLSTFSNMLCFETFVETGATARGHYVYDVRGDKVVERLDNGFPNASRLVVQA
jgi:hypothetical protein